MYGYDTSVEVVFTLVILLQIFKLNFHQIISLTVKTKNKSGSLIIYKCLYYSEIFLCRSFLCMNRFFSRNTESKMNNISKDK